MIRQVYSVASSDRRALAWWALAALIGIAVVIRYHNEALPSAAIDFRVTRVEAEQKAAAFLAEQGYDATSYRPVTTFNYDDDARVYLERELGLEQANRLTRRDVSVWYWDTRFFRPQQQEEFSVAHSPSGQMVGFSHEIEEIREGASLPQQEARAIAERFVETTRKLDLAQYRLIEGQTTVRENRSDHAFTWERIGFTAREATYRIGVVIHGDRMGEYTEYLKVPEAWQRDYAQLRSGNELSQFIATIGLIGLVIALIIVFFRYLPAGKLRWRFGIQSGAILAVTSIALTLNLLPLTITRYDTTQSLETFYATIVLFALVSAGGWFLFITLVNTVGDAVYRDRHPDRLSLEWLFSTRALRTGEYVSASLIGYLIPCVMLGYITAFYLVGNRLGVWSPAGVDYTDMASTALPWLYPLTIGLQASIFEEGLFRLFAIPFLKKHLKSTFLAVLIPAVCWGFLHSNYPQQPFFIRGLELTVVGVMLGYVFLRHGILCTLIAHYVFDALVLSLFLFQSSRPYFQIAGGLVVGAMMIPLIPSLIAWRRGYLVNDPALLNRAAAEAPAPSESQASSDIAAPEKPAVPAGALMETGPSGRGATFVLWTAAIAGAVLVTITPVERFLDFMDVRIGRAEAVRIAEEHLRQRGADVSGFKRVATYSTAPGAPNHAWGIRYIRQHAGITGLNAAYQDRLRPANWVVRFFRPLEKEEYQVAVSPGGQISGYDHLIDEKAPGDSLSVDAAQTLASAAAQGRESLFDAYHLVESEQERRVARTDHFFAWEDSLHPVAEGHFRLQATVQGREVTQVRASFKPPELWIRQQQERTMKDIIMLAVGIMLSGFMGALTVLIFVERLRAGAVNWRFGLNIAAILAGLTILDRLNEWPSWYSGYQTTESLESFFVQNLLSSFLVSPALLMALGVLLVSFSESAYRMVYPERLNLIRWFGQVFRGDRQAGREVFRNALVLSYAACLLAPGIRHALDLWTVWAGVDASFIAPAVRHTDSAWPAVAAMINALSTALLGGALLLAAWLLIRHYSRRQRWVPAILLLAVVVFRADDARTWGEFGAGLTRTLALIGVMGLCMRYVWRDNLLAYGLTIFLMSLTTDGWAMIEGSTGVYRTSGVIILCLAFIPAIAGFWWFYLRGDSAREKKSFTY